MYKPLAMGLTVPFLNGQFCIKKKSQHYNLTSCIYLHKLHCKNKVVIVAKYFVTTVASLSLLGVAEKIFMQWELKLDSNLNKLY